MQNDIRKTIRQKLMTQAPEQRAEKSARIKERLFQEKDFIKAQCVMFYVSTEEEVDTRAMIDGSQRAGKKVCIPVIKDDMLIASELQDTVEELEQGAFGIYQPKGSRIREVPLEEIDVVIVPGIVFDRTQMRIGRGKGYYDRFLRRLSPRTTTIGLAFDFQLVDHIPAQPHDSPVGKVITA